MDGIKRAYMDRGHTARSRDDVWAQRNYRGRSEDALQNHAPVDHGVGTVLARLATALGSST